MGDTVKISDIRIGERARKDMGDLAALARSIETHGLLHPIVVKPDMELVAGERRIKACMQLGWTEIPVRIVDVADLLSAERDENSVRKDFTPSEAVAIARVIEEATKETNKEIKRQKIAATARMRKRNGEGHFLANDQTGTNLPHLDSTRAAIAASDAVGMAKPTYYRARKIVEAAEADSSHADLVEEMDRTGKVSGVYAELERRKKGERNKRHAVMKKLHYPKPNREVERSIHSLAGICDVLTRIKTDQLDQEKAPKWANELKTHAATIAKFARNMA